MLHPRCVPSLIAHPSCTHPLRVTPRLWQDGKKARCIVSTIHWFEIGVDDIERAAAFYGAVFDTKLHVLDLSDSQGTLMAMLPAPEGVGGGGLVYGPQHGYAPSMGGTLVYITIDDDIDAALARAVDAGGEVLLPKTPLGDGEGGGAVAWLKDSEGNKVGLFSQQ